MTHLISNSFITQLVDIILLLLNFKMLYLPSEIAQLDQYLSFGLLTMQNYFCIIQDSDSRRNSCSSSTLSSEEEYHRITTDLEGDIVK